MLTLATVLVSASLAAALAPSNKTVVQRACASSNAVWCDSSKPLQERVDAVVQALRSSEYGPLLTARGNPRGNTFPVERLGLPAYDYGLNALHGTQTLALTWANGTSFAPTSFPMPVSLGMSWNSSVYRFVGAVIGEETRAMYLWGSEEFSAWSGQAHIGLDQWSPVLNLAHDPRWGRTQEVPSEDPLSLASYTSAFSMGSQWGMGEAQGFAMTVPTLKHFAAYSLEDSDGFTRYNFNAVLSPYEIASFFLPGFEHGVRAGGAQGVMCSYNALNGVPTCASSFLRKTLRDTWGFEGYQTSDTDAVQNIYNQHHYTSTWSEAIALALVHGQTDVNSVGSGPGYWGYLEGALNGSLPIGNVSTADLKTATLQALSNTFGLRIQLGLFDPIESQPLWHLPLSVIRSNETMRQLDLLTDQSMVLLKNHQELPLRPGKHIAVIGPHAKAQSALLASYLGQVCPGTDANSVSCIETPLDAISAINTRGTTTFAQGCSVTGSPDFGPAVTAAQSADHVLLFLGIDESIEAESHDRTSVDLPEVQHQLFAALQKTSTPITVILLHGGPTSIEQELQGAAAVIDVGYPGMRGASAIARAVFGVTNAFGKSAQTIYPANITSQVKMSNMSLSAAPGRTYMFYSATPLVPFGFGLSYTTFSLATTPPHPTSLPTATSKQWDAMWKETNAMLKAGKTVEDARNSVAASVGLDDAKIQVTVTNTGAVEGAEVVQVYLMGGGPTPGAGQVPLIRRLIAYQRVTLAPSAHTTLSISISALDLISVASEASSGVEEGDRVSRPGSYTILVTNGNDQNSQQTITLTGATNVVEPFQKKAWEEDLERGKRARKY